MVMKLSAKPDREYASVMVLPNIKLTKRILRILMINVGTAPNV